MPQHLTEAEFSDWLGRIAALRASHAVTEAAAARAITETAPAEPVQRPLHELSNEEWRDTAHAYWAEQPTGRRRAPQTIEDLLSGDRPAA